MRMDSTAASTDGNPVMRMTARSGSCRLARPSNFMPSKPGMRTSDTTRWNRSDLTRTRYFGKISSKFRKIYDIVNKSQSAGIARVREGITAGEVDFICRQAIKISGYGDFFIHGTGHGVGLDIHEPPRRGTRYPARWTRRSWN